MPTSAPPAAPLAPVSTYLLSPDERLRVDAAGAGLYQALHRDSLDATIRDVRERQAAAVLLGAARCTRADAARVARMVREFPRVPAVALLSAIEPPVPQAVLALGRSGVETIVDVRQPSGWRELRGVLLADRGGELRRQALDVLAQDLDGAPPDCHRFFDALFTPSGNRPVPGTVDVLSRRLGVIPATLTSRFFRAGLPTARRYLATARLVRAARLLESPGMTVADVAVRLDFSSPQAFGRHVRLTLGMTAGQYRRRYDGAGMLERFRQELVLPFLATLRAFHPLDGRMRWE